MPKSLTVDAELTLEARHPSDAAEMFALIDPHRDELRDWLTWIDATRSIDDVRRYAQFARAQFETMSLFDYGIYLDGAMAGAAGLHQIDWTSRKAEMGYWLAPQARGRGAMTRAAAALTTLAFDALELHRLEIHCVVENAKSRAVAERLNYRLEGIMRQAYALHGAFRDLTLYAMLAPEWRALNSAG
jgi:ribosomal-protein-serine acetyltransferase